MRLADAHIRAALSAQLHQCYDDDPDTLIRHELGVCAGQRRLDIAVINGRLAGYEIKSDRDTLTRLAGQAEVYGRVCDRLTLVTTPRFLDQALTQLPAWWGVVRAEPADTDCALHPVRDPEPNRGQDPFALAQLLWRDEALLELHKRGLGRTMSKLNRGKLWRCLAQIVPLPELRAVVCDRLRARSDWPGGQ